MGHEKASANLGSFSARTNSLSDFHALKGELLHSVIQSQPFSGAAPGAAPILVRSVACLVLSPFCPIPCKEKIKLDVKLGFHYAS